MSALGAGSLVVVTGAGGPAGAAVVRALVATGATVVGADIDQSRLDATATSLGDAAARFTGQVVDLLDAERVRTWADEVAESHPSGTPRVDGVVHLVGGWRGGALFTDNTVTDAAWLHDLLVRTLQHVSLAFHDHLLASPSSRFTIVSATATERPTAGNAAYAASKAGAEAWTMALADSFGKARPDAYEGQTAAAVVLVVKALVHDAMREAKPDATFAGYTDVHDLAAQVVALWDVDAATLNGTRKALIP
jgi:NADP-dependent 3-hydroxy acid dehydrogenase YdfG